MTQRSEKSTKIVLQQIKLKRQSSRDALDNRKNPNINIHIENLEILNNIKDLKVKKDMKQRRIIKHTKNIKPKTAKPVVKVP
jgi:retron-type reverse transcriptase